MHLHITPHHVSLTPSLRDFAAAKLAILDERLARVHAAHVVLRHEAAHAPEGRFSARVRLAVRGNDVHAQDTGADLYAVIDRVVEKLARRLRKRKTRWLRHQHGATTLRHDPRLLGWPRPAGDEN